ncbi:MAG: hypothetical protein UR60_C0045G0005 [Candidatus Moranbacteria bacterium GW2011_GWF2_34_56]|nr:MAG: hypothetical protein UR51_C0006G0055 [Candidatus Moranbacteria bacterium GW2011_GWF1_34_10]KKP63326.1 MAG: hypothetical protein UR60_C0045G0005 [Candidatus Moranbacteria bacterium GW2011_GWF2_34_56]HBI16698.1 hypothetical protein [Candidatus Moranbacteria bacterium]
MEKMIEWSKGVEKNENLDEMVLQAIKKIECEGYGIGEGRTATVCALEGRFDVCVKILNKSIRPKNGATEEMRFLDKLKSKKFPVPQAVCCAKTERSEYVFMEMIDGLSILDLIEDDLFEELPENFDFKGFFEKLREIVKRMHSENIYHRDLRPGNVMVDKIGNPVIIDFGESKELSLSTEEPYIDENSLGEARIISPDENRIIELCKELGSYLKNKNYFTR